MSNILEVIRIFKSYGKKTQQVQVLQDISIVVEKGTRVVVTGESGSGKTTLLSVISGLDTIDSGEITISSVKISCINEEAKAKFRLLNIGFVFQYHYLLQDFTALGNVMLPLHMLGYTKAEAKEKSLCFLEKIGLIDRKNHLPSQLSGGECQRIAIARALVHQPLLVLADEPTGALDSKNSEIVRELLCNLVQEQQTTLLIASHDRDFLGIADKHWHFTNGTIEPVIHNHETSNL